MRKIIYSVLHVTAAVFCIFLAAAAVCGCSGMNGAAGNMTGKEEKRLNEEMAEKIEKLGVQGTSHIIFIIGGSIGLGKVILKRSDYALSFSKMTFPHQLMRVILLEQIYRSYRIMNHEPYHK